MSEISILLVGHTDRSEFCRARTALEARGPLVCVPDMESAVAALQSGQITPDVIVAAQSYPAEFSHEAIDRLRRAAPLGQVLGLMGSWCEGEARTGRPWPAAIRVYWHQWLPRCDQELGRLGRGQCSAWGLPMTASDEERLLLAADQQPTRLEGLIAIHSRSCEMGDWLSAALRSRGCSTVWLRPPRPARVAGAMAAVFDGSDCRGRELDELKHLCGALAPAPVITLLDFPRIEEHDRALHAGAAAVLSKPLQLDDLDWQLDRVLAADSDRPS
ncbi:MAG: hypothetical protein JXB62_14665 [Pirellulales bacterium]|nr:hypothetical protein [Pirellulales bacterium]